MQLIIEKPHCYGGAFSFYGARQRAEGRDESLYVKGFRSSSSPKPDIIESAAKKNFADYLNIKLNFMKQQTSAASETQTKGRNIIDYSGKAICVGIDVHQKDYQVAKVYNGICLGNHRMAASAEGLIEHLRNHYPGAEFKCIYESCAWGFNLQRKLVAAGMDCIVVHAADVSTTDKERKRKTDPVDALKLACDLESRALKGKAVGSRQ